MTFADLESRHAGETIWICGSGSSLDALDLARLRGPRIYLNRVAFALPPSAGETYWLAVDDWKSKQVPGPWTEHLDRVRNGTAGTTAVLRNPLLGRPRSVPAPEGPNIVHFGDAKAGRDDLLRMNRADIAAAAQLYQYYGTGATALHLAWFLGASAVVLSGMDGGGGIAHCLRAFYDDRVQPPYGPALLHLEKVAGILRLPLARATESAAAVPAL